MSHLGCGTFLYEIYTHKDMSRNHFERLFNEHLKMVNSSTDFRGALQIFKILSTAMQHQLANKNYGPLITSIFAKRGIQ